MADTETKPKATNSIKFVKFMPTYRSLLLVIAATVTSKTIIPYEYDEHLVVLRNDCAISMCTNN